MSNEYWKVAKATGSISIKYKLLNDKAKPPCRAHPDDAGLDICITEDLGLPPGSRWPASTGLAFQLPEGTYGRLAPRSGLAAKFGVDLLAGVID